MHFSKQLVYSPPSRKLLFLKKYHLSVIECSQRLSPRRNSSKEFVYIADGSRWVTHSSA